MSDKLKKDSFGGNVNDGIIHRLSAVVNCIRTGGSYNEEDLLTVCEEAIDMIEGLAHNRDEIYEKYKAAEVEIQEFRQRGILFDISIGDTVYTACEETDEYGNPITALVPGKVRGLAYKDGKQYAIDDEGALNEINTRFCIPTDKPGTKLKSEEKKNANA